MKIIAVLDTSIFSGGAFNQSFNAILQMEKLSKMYFHFSVLTFTNENVDYLKKININATYVKRSLFDKLIPLLSSGQIGHRILSKLRIIGKLEKKLIQQGCDLVYFPTPTLYAASLQKLNYIVTVWDLCHQDNLEFPEVRSFGEFNAREVINRKILNSALAIIVESEKLAHKIAIRYDISQDRVIPMPTSPSPFLNNFQDNKKNMMDVLKFYGLELGYFFYPAQLWPHKNHIRILQALKILNKQGLRLRVVFAGGDQGNLSYIQEMIRKYSLVNQVKLLGFVPIEDMSYLYKGCIAVVMPTYFGPTNLPPIEAWSIGKPLIYSKQLSDHSKDAAILIDPDNADDIAKAIQSLYDDDNIKRYVKNGYKRINHLDLQRKKSEDQLVSILTSFENKLDCWPP
jgi:glycosyltransferase involved in cell wall biosynthesis